MSASIVLMFPGQSSREPAMLEKLVARHPQCAAMVGQASEILGRDLARHYRTDNPDIFATNRDVQTGVFLANQLHATLLHQAGITARWSLGLSLGEYNHLVHIGALSFEAALRLVDRRGQLYDQAQGGRMVSLYPVEAALVEATIGRLGLEGRVAIGLYNSPRQQVISGEQNAVEQVVAALEGEILIDATPIEPRIPMHSPVFAPIGLRLGALIDEAPLRAPALPYVPNVLGSVKQAATVAEIRDCLVRHTWQPVLWQRSIEALGAAVDCPCFVEVGPRAVLSHLFGRGWNPGRRFSTDAPEDGRGHLDAIVAQLADAGCGAVP